MRARPRPSARLAVLTLAVLVGAAPLSAEVSIVFDGDAAPSTLLMAITDHPDPIGQIAWQPVVLKNEAYTLNPDGFDRGDAGPAFAWWQDSAFPVVAWSYKAGTDFDVAVAEWQGSFWDGPVFLSETLEDELDPRVAVDDETGRIHVVWWQDFPEERVFLSTRQGDGAWSIPEQVNPPGQGGRRPSVIAHEGLLFVAYERGAAVEGTFQEIVIAAREPDGDFVTQVIAETTRLERLDAVLHRRLDALWVDWKHDVDRFGWSVFDGASWSPPTLADWIDPTWIGVEQTRQSIEGQVLP